MILRPTKIEDISRVIDIINQAKTYFKNNDIDQWQDGYPNEETIEKDIENNEAYVLEEDGVILGTCMVLDQIKEILKDTMDIDESKITLDAKLKEDLELDSLDSVELIMSAEEEFGIEIPDEDVMNFKTVNDIVNYIEEHK